MHTNYLFFELNKKKINDIKKKISKNLFIFIVSQFGQILKMINANVYYVMKHCKLFSLF